nr:hypothetical protein [uncultured Cohaesibacter sp.]
MAQVAATHAVATLSPFWLVLLAKAANMTRRLLPDHKRIASIFIFIILINLFNFQEISSARTHESIIHYKILAKYGDICA